MTVDLAVRDGFEIVYAENLVQRSTAVPHTAGGRLPAHFTAPGEARAISLLSEPDIREPVVALGLPSARISGDPHLAVPGPVHLVGAPTGDGRDFDGAHINQAAKLITKLSCCVAPAPLI